VQPWLFFSPLQSACSGVFPFLENRFFSMAANSVFLFCADGGALFFSSFCSEGRCCLDFLLCRALFGCEVPFFTFLRKTFDSSFPFRKRGLFSFWSLIFLFFDDLLAFRSLSFEWAGDFFLLSLRDRGCPF